MRVGTNRWSRGIRILLNILFWGLVAILFASSNYIVIVSKEISVSYPTLLVNSMENWLLVRTSQKDSQGRTHTSIRSDFRRVDGLLISFKFKNIGPLRGNRQGVTLVDTLRVELSKSLDQGLFRFETMDQETKTLPER